MASEHREDQTTVVSGTAQDIEARVAAIKESGGTLISIRMTTPADDAGKVAVEITHTSPDQGSTR